MFVSISGVSYYSISTWGDYLSRIWADMLELTWGATAGLNSSQVMASSSPQVRDLVEDRSTADFSIWDPNHEYRFTKGEYVQIIDTNFDIIFTGFIEVATEKRITPTGGIEHVISCVDNHYLADKRIIAKAFVSPSTVADCVDWIVTNILLQEGVTIGEVIAPQDIVEIAFDYITVAEALGELANYAGTTWFIDSSKKLYFVPHNTYPAAWNIEEVDNVLTDVLATSFSKNSGNPEYRNIQYIRGGSAMTDTQIEKKVGDGQTTSWSVGYRIGKEPTIYVNDVKQDVGIKGLESEKDFYWAADDQVILQDPLAVPLQKTDILRIEYNGLYDIVVSSTDFSAVYNRRTIELSSGRVEAVVDDPLVHTQDAGLDKANSLLSHYATVGTKIFYSTMRGGLEVGTLQHITSAIHDLDGDFLITQIDKCPVYYDDYDTTNALIQYNVTAVMGPVEDYWTKVFLKMNKGTISPTLASSQFVVIGQRLYTHTWTNPDTSPDIWTSAVADGTFQLDNALIPCFELGDEVSYISLWSGGVEKFRKYRTAQTRISTVPAKLLTTFILASGECNDFSWDTVRFYGGDNVSDTLGSGTVIYTEMLDSPDFKTRLESVQINFMAISY